jgi:hypothetical protein
MDLVLGGTRLKMGTDGSRRWGLLATRLMHGDYDNNLLPARRFGAIKTGKLSATRREDGSWSIAPSWPDTSTPTVTASARKTGDADQPEIAPATDMLVAELRGVIADLRADRDARREQAQRLTLPAPKPV